MELSNKKYYLVYGARISLLDAIKNNQFKKFDLLNDNTSLKLTQEEVEIINSVKNAKLDEWANIYSQHYDFMKDFLYKRLHLSTFGDRDKGEKNDGGYILFALDSNDTLYEKSGKMSDKHTKTGNIPYSKLTDLYKEANIITGKKLFEIRGYPKAAEGLNGEPIFFPNCEQFFALSSGELNREKVKNDLDEKRGLYYPKMYFIGIEREKWEHPHKKYTLREIYEDNYHSLYGENNDYSSDGQEDGYSDYGNSD